MCVSPRGNLAESQPDQGSECGEVVVVVVVGGGGGGGGGGERQGTKVARHWHT